MNNSRDKFTSGFGTLAATLGSAVGLGNIWKFPYLTGDNGGAAFLLVYLLSTLLIGLPVMIAELSLGRKAKANAFGTFKVLTPDKKNWRFAGLAGMLAAFFIMAFYTEVAAWVYAYIAKAVSGNILTTNPKAAALYFKELVTSPVQSVLWQWAVFAVIGTILMMGVSRGIEAATKRLMPVLFLILIALCVRGLMLQGGTEGLRFLFKPDFTKLTAASVLTAMGLSFFKLSIGMGTMITYGSYFSDKQDIPKTALRVMLADLLVSMLAGIAIFPAVFSFGFKPDAGASLLFITVPAVFSSLPMGQLFVIIFFVLAAVASTGAMLSLLEVPVAFFAEEMHMSRTKSVLLTIGLLALLGAPAALSNSTLADFKLLGKTFFDMYDFLTSNIVMPVGGIAIACYTAWMLGKERPIGMFLAGNGSRPLAGQILFLLRYITPVLILIVLLAGLKFF
jgi:NSS family neurotransmitter:Na+ symporter